MLEQLPLIHGEKAAALEFKAALAAVANEIELRTPIGPANVTRDFGPTAKFPVDKSICLRQR